MGKTPILRGSHRCRVVKPGRRKEGEEVAARRERPEGLDLVRRHLFFPSPTATKTQHKKTLNKQTTTKTPGGLTAMGWLVS